MVEHSFFDFCLAFVLFLFLGFSCCLGIIRGFVCFAAVRFLGVVLFSVIFVLVLWFFIVRLGLSVFAFRLLVCRLFDQSCPFSIITVSCARELCVCSVDCTCVLLLWDFLELFRFFLCLTLFPIFLIPLFWAVVAGFSCCMVIFAYVCFF